MKAEDRPPEEGYWEGKEGKGTVVQVNLRKAQWCVCQNILIKFIILPVN